MKFIKINSRNFDCILNQSISRIRRALSLRALDDDEMELLASFEYSQMLGFSLSFDNKDLRVCLENYCYGTSTFNK